MSDAAQRWADGVYAGRANYATAMAHLLSRPELRVHRPSGKLCGISDCKRRAFRGELCRAHWQMVPMGRRMDVCVSSIQAAHFAAEKVKAEILLEVKALEDAAFGT